MFCNNNFNKKMYNKNNIILINYKFKLYGHLITSNIVIFCILKIVWLLEQINIIILFKIIKKILFH